jgi:hypothetical protein
MTLKSHENLGKCWEKSSKFGKIYPKICLIQVISLQSSIEIRRNFAMYAYDWFRT